MTLGVATGPTASSYAPNSSAGEDSAVLALVRIVLLHPRAVLVIVIGALLAPILVRLVGDPEYRAESQFTPETQRSELSQLGGIAAQFGFNLGNLGSSDPVKFHAELLLSHGLLVDAATSRYRFATGSAQSDTLEGTLLDLYDIRGRMPKDRLRRAVRRLRADAAVILDREAGLVKVRTVAPWPELAEALNRRLLDLVAVYNVERRQSRWRAEREFVEGRLANARAELAQAEAALATFLQRNRRYQDDPALLVEHARLFRAVDLAQQTVVTLTQSYEQARIAEVRNTPVVSVVDRPEGTARRSGNLLLDAIVWLLVGLAVAIGFALTAELTARYRQEHPEAVAELRGLFRTARDRLRLRRRASA